MRAFTCGMMAGFATCCVPVVALGAWALGESRPWRWAWNQGVAPWLEAARIRRAPRSGKTETAKGGRQVRGLKYVAICFLDRIVDVRIFRHHFPRYCAWLAEHSWWLECGRVFVGFGTDKHYLCDRPNGHAGRHFGNPVDEPRGPIA